ncbi:MAG: HAD-IA family hydrolase, partial [Plesiomonas shigelloides]
DADVDLIYSTFMPLQIEAVERYADLIPDVLPVLQRLQAQGIRIGSCSGYPRAVMERLVPAAAERGYRPDHWVATDDLAAGGRPGPWMVLANVIALGLPSVWQCVKVDDSAPGIVEGRNAGMWTVGLSITGNEFGASLAEFNAMSAELIAQRRASATLRLQQAGAHYVIDSLAQIESVLADINRRLAEGERP